MLKAELETWRTRPLASSTSSASALRLRFDVLTKTKQPEFHPDWTTPDRAANVQLYCLAAEILGAVADGCLVRRPAWCA